jgi:hypothetical protein
MPRLKKVTAGDIEDTVVSDDVATTIEDDVEKPVIAAAEIAAETALHIPPAVDPVIDNFVQTRLFALTNLATHEFLPVIGHYVVEIEAAAIAKAHEAEIKAAIEAKFLEATGIRLLNNLLHFVEVTGAKLIPHKKD